MSGERSGSGASSASATPVGRLTGAVRRLSSALLAVSIATLLAAAPASALKGRQQALGLRVAVPAAGDYSLLGFELSIGGEGKAHRRQPVALSMRNLHRRGVFALARIRPAKGAPGRFLGELVVFHRAGGKAAAAPGARASGGPLEELIVRAVNEHIIKQHIKANIIALATAHHLGEDDFCDPAGPQTYLLGNQIIGAAVLLSQPLAALPTHTTLPQLADDATSELCDYIEDEEEEEDDEAGESAFLIVNGFLGVQGPVYPLMKTAPPPTTPPMTPYHVIFNGVWGFEGPNEVKLTATFSGIYGAHGARAADSTNPITAVKVVAPPSGTTPRQITNQLCPAQLPSVQVTTTTSPNDTLVCSGGAGIPLDQQFTLNVQTNPAPSAGMGGQLYAQQDGAYLPPFSITGP